MVHDLVSTDRRLDFGVAPSFGQLQLCSPKGRKRIIVRTQQSHWLCLSRNGGSADGEPLRW